MGPSTEHDTTEKRMISCTYVRTYIHTYIHTHTHTYIHIVRIYIQRIQKFARIIGCGIKNMQIVRDTELLKHTYLYRIRIQYSSLNIKNSLIG